MNQTLNQHCFTYITAAVLLGPLSVAAQEKPGFYAKVYGGANFMPSTSFSESRATEPSVGGKVDFGSGIGFGIAVGQRYSNGWVTELAWDERGSFLKRIGGVAVDGNIFSETVFLNGYYRFPSWGTVRPYIGAGLGYVVGMDIDIDRNGTEQEYARKGGVAIQAIAGVEYNLSSRWSLSGDVRWSRMGSGTFNPTTLGTALNGTPKYQPASVNLSFSYQF
jgi:opacity protein-like surface antigen